MSAAFSRTLVSKTAGREDGFCSWNFTAVMVINTDSAGIVEGLVISDICMQQRSVL